MSLTVKLAQNVVAAQEDKVTLKATSIPYQISRKPIVFPLPGGTILALDMGRIEEKIPVECIIDEHAADNSFSSELFVDTVGGTGSFVAGETITGTAAFNANVTPIRTGTPTAVVRAGVPNLTTPTTLIVDTWGPSADNGFFVNNETISGATRTALVNEPLASFHRWEQIAESFYLAGPMTLTTEHGTYSVQILDISAQREAGKNYYTGKITFVRVA